MRRSDKPVSEAPSPYLRVAAETVATRLAREANRDPLEVRREVCKVARAIETRSDWLEPESERAGRPAFRKRVLELLSTEVIQGWVGSASPPSSVEMLELIASFDYARRALDETSSRVAGPANLPEAPALVAELAHDLRSPLTSILFLCETLRMGQSGPINEVQHRQLGIIYSAALSLVSMASDVIELSRVGDRLIEPEPTSFSIAEMFGSIRDLVGPAAEERGVKIRVLPPATDSRLGFPVALSRVLLNLTTNGVRFTDEGIVEIIAREVDSARIEFSVRDTGRGIDPERVHLLFEPFHLESSTGRYGFSGSGLGLAISRRLVRSLGSDLRFETSPGWGTRFFFEVFLPPVGHA